MRPDLHPFEPPIRSGRRLEEAGYPSLISPHFGSPVRPSFTQRVAIAPNQRTQAWQLRQRFSKVAELISSTLGCACSSNTRT